MAKRIGILLSGCGVKDGSEIHESVLTLLHVVKQGATPVFMAPDADQPKVINHLTGQEAKEKRNMLVEAARIARGNIKNIKDVKAKDLDALILPGGFGAANNLCDFASKGPDCTANDEVARLIHEVHNAKKPIGAICIAPAVIARVLGEDHPELTIGTDKGTAGALEKMGVKHVNCAVDAFHADKAKKIVTTPAYMLGQTIADIDAGIGKLVKTVVEMA